MVKIPDKLLLRRSEVIQCLGITSRELSKMVDAGLIQKIYLAGGKKGSNAYYRRVDIVKLAGCEQS